MSGRVVVEEAVTWSMDVPRRRMLCRPAQLPAWVMIVMFSGLIAFVMVSIPVALFAT